MLAALCVCLVCLILVDLFGLTQAGLRGTWRDKGLWLRSSYNGQCDTVLFRVADGVETDREGAMKGYSNYMVRQAQAWKTLGVRTVFDNVAAYSSPHFCAIVYHSANELKQDLANPASAKVARWFAGRHRVFLSVFFTNDYADVSLLNGTTLMVETEDQFHICNESHNRPELANIDFFCATLPFCFGHGEFHPLRPILARRSPLLYLKTHSNLPHQNRTRVTSIMAAAGVTEDELAAVQWFVTGGGHAFDGRAYLRALEDAPYMIAYSPSDNFFAAEKEARAMGVPVFALNDDITAYSSPLSVIVANMNTLNNDTVVAQRLRVFLEALWGGQLDSRADLTRFGLLGLDACATRLLNVLTTRAKVQVMRHRAAGV